MGFLGQEIGNEVGGLIGGYVGNKFKNKKSGQKIGSMVGRIAGSYVPFQHGGVVKHVSKSLKNKIKRGGGRNMC